MGKGLLDECSDYNHEATLPPGSVRDNVSTAQRKEATEVKNRLVGSHEHGYSLRGIIMYCLPTKEIMEN